MLLARFRYIRDVGVKEGTLILHDMELPDGAQLIEGRKSSVLCVDDIVGNEAQKE